MRQRSGRSTEFHLPRSQEQDQSLDHQSLLQLQGLLHLDIVDPESWNQASWFLHSCRRMRKKDKEDTNSPFTGTILFCVPYLCAILFIILKGHVEISATYHNAEWQNVHPNRAIRSKALLQPAEQRGNNLSCIFGVSGYWVYLFQFNDLELKLHLERKKNSQLVTILHNYTIN